VLFISAREVHGPVVRPIDEIQPVRPNLICWSAYDPSVKADLSCCAVVTPVGTLFVDPLPLAEEPLAQLSAAGPALGVIVTNANHERASALFAGHFHVPIYSCAPLTRAIAISESAPPPGVEEVVELPGFGEGEIALLYDGILVMGDALIHLAPQGLSMLPEKYCSNPKAGRASLRKLLRLSFEVMTFAHGPPLVREPRRRLEELLA
jgi:hypothetical protein